MPFDLGTRNLKRAVGNYERLGTRDTLAMGHQLRIEAAKTTPPPLIGAVAAGLRPTLAKHQAAMPRQQTAPSHAHGGQLWPINPNWPALHFYAAPDIMASLSSCVCGELLKSAKVSARLARQARGEGRSAHGAQVLVPEDGVGLNRSLSTTAFRPLQEKNDPLLAAAAFYLASPMT